MSIRYMGTKRRIAPLVQRAIEMAGGGEELIDLFCGTGTIARSVAPDMSVTLNDALAFIACLARANFCWQGNIEHEQVLKQLKPHFDERQRALTKEFADRLREEALALKSCKTLLAFIGRAPHVGSDTEWRRRALLAKDRRDADRYELACLYFSSSYFSIAQAIELDALRYAIDSCVDAQNLDVLLAVLLTTSSEIINAPGHSAQFMKPSSKTGYDRLRSQWRRNVWSAFSNNLASFEPVGSREWRAGNRVFNRDALSLVSDPDIVLKGIAYADPPYTSDQYSRFYHVFETLYLYDFPESTGAGRYRSGRHVSDFSLATKVVEAVEDLAEALSEKGCALVLSYPSNGLLSSRGSNLSELLAESYASVVCIEQDLEHSRMGSPGEASTKSAKEQVYVCQQSA